MRTVDFYDVNLVNFMGKRRDWLVGRGSDGSVWVEAGFYELNRTDVKMIWRAKKESVVVLVNERRVMIEMSTFISLCPEPEVRKELTAQMDDYCDALHPTNFR